MFIDWKYPEPRKGLGGALDRFVGPGATKVELWLQLVPALVAGIAAPFYVVTHGMSWSTAQLVVAGVLGFDMVGGVLTNATSSAKRWYHRPGQGWEKHFGFVSVHLVYLFVVSWLFRHMDWWFFVGTSAYLLIGALVVLRTPLYLRRPVAYLLYVWAILMSFYVFEPIEGLEWFLPFFYLKLLVSHSLREEPYRPRPAAVSGRDDEANLVR